MTTKKKVLGILECIDVSKAAGTDNVSRRCIKDGEKILAKPTAEIYSTSISLGLFPRDYKIDKLKPLYKKGFKTKSENLKLIFLLLLVSRIIERIVYDDVDHFVFYSK